MSISALLASHVLALPLAGVALGDETDAAHLFPRGTRMLTTEVKFGFGLEREQEMPAVGLGWEYFVIDNLSLGVELQGIGVFQEPDDTALVALEARLRHHVVAWDDGTFFIGAGVGPSYAHEPVPTGGTHFNFVSHAGLGLTQRLGDDNTFLLAGVDYWHLSNGNIPDGGNPTINGVQGFVGIGWSF